MVPFVPAICLDTMWIVWLTIAVFNYFNAYVSITKLLSLYYDQLPLEKVYGPGEIVFSGWFFFPHHATLS